jgi:mannose-6-phosphate isomerase-like protein (cupin superfamily)
MEELTMKEKRTYKVVDCLKSIDIRTNTYVPGARTRVGGSHDGKQDLGHVCKSIYEYDNFGLLWVIQEAGVSSPYNDFVYHPGVDEIEFVLGGECTFSCPDGFNTKLTPGTCFYLLNSMPHENTHNELDNLNLLVYYPRRVSEVGRAEFKAGTPYTGNGKCGIVNYFETPAEEIAPGHHRLITCNAKDICASYQRLEPGCSVPEVNFITHDTDEIIFILEGTGVATYPDKSYQLRPHLAFYNPAGTAHKFWNNSDKDLKMLVLYTRDNVEDVKTETKTFLLD